MTKAEWGREVLKALIDRNMRMTRFAKDLDCSTQWIYKVISTPEEKSTGAIEFWEELISSRLDIPTYREKGLSDEKES